MDNSPDSELLMDSRPNSLFDGGQTLANDAAYSINNLKENLVEGVQASTPDHEGNVNCAMDLFAPDQSSMSSSNSRLSCSSTIGKANHSTSSEPKDTSDSDRVNHFKAKLSNNYMTLLNEHDQQDATSVASDSSAGDFITASCQATYSPRNSPSTSSHKLHPQRAVSPHFPHSNITFPKTSRANQWTSFGEDKENKLPNSQKIKIAPVRPPPAIPDRKSIRNNRGRQACGSPVVFAQSPIPAPSPSADLLSMDNDDLDLHLSDASSPVPPPIVPYKPAIPPRRSLFSTASSLSGSGSHGDDSDHDLLTIAPEPKGHINHAHLSSGSESSLEFLQKSVGIPGPPVPPRKNLPVSHMNIAVVKKDDTSGSLSDFDPFSQLTEAPPSINTTSSTPSWVNFEDFTPVTPKTPIQFIETQRPATPQSETNSTEKEQSFGLKIETAEFRTSGLDDVEPLQAEGEDDPHWRKPSSSPDVRSSATKKKGTGGIGYLSLKNDDCDNMESSENLDRKCQHEAITILLPENDLSPEKPQSQWATFQNEYDDEDHNNLDIITDNVSRANSLPSIGINSSGFAGSLNELEADLDDDFGLGIGNRLSTEMPDLKGFNRADKGSQNNLVDFSDDRGSTAISTGSHDDPDDEMETILDLTAQGDSLKRKRPKGAFNMEMVNDVTDGMYGTTKSDTSVPHGNLPFHVGPAGINDSVFEEEQLVDLPDAQKIVQNAVRTPTPHSPLSSRATTPFDAPPESSSSSGSCNKSAMPTNPFWSSVGTSAPTSSQCSSVDSPFDNIVFSPKSSQSDSVFSKPSTPLRINPASTPVTPCTLVRLPPPPLSGSRSSSRARRSSQARERTRNPSHGSTSAKKLELDYASDTSAKASTLPSSRADTPIHITINEKNFDEFQSVQGSVTQEEDIFDPFSIQTSDLPNSNTANMNSNDLFSWVDDTSTDPTLVETQPQLPQNGRLIDDKQDITLVLNQLEKSDQTSKNINANANIIEGDRVALTPVADDVEDDSIVDSYPTQTSTTTPDPLVELKKATSVESPLGMTISRKCLLPEVELVDSKTSWDVYMRFPPAKRTMGNRKWVPIHVKLVCEQVNNPLIKLYYTEKAQEPFRTVSLASHQMQLSKPKLQAHYSDEGQVLGKLHALKLMLIHYKEKQTFSPRRSLTKNASGFKHACKGKQSIKFGFTVHYDVISFSKATRDAMFNAHKRLPKSKEEEHTATVKYHSRDEFLVDVQDELQAIINESGVMEACKVRVYFFVSSFLSGDPMAKLTLNDRKIEGKEVVRREDIIPTSMEGWIDIRDPELHESCTPDSYSEAGGDVGVCTMYPPDATRFEMMRFATTYSEKELPVTLKSSITVKGARLHLRCILRMSAHHSANKDPLAQIDCEDVMVMFPVPDEWGAFFRVDGRFRNHSVRAKRAAKQRRKPSSEAVVTMEASVGVAKYEKAYKAIVWRLPRLPEKNAVQNTPRVFSCRIELPSDRDLDRLRTTENGTDAQGDGYRGALDEKYRWCEVGYTMAGPTASNVCVRSVSLPNTDRAEKFVSYQSHYFYKVGVNVTVESVSAEGEEDPANFCNVQ